MAPRSAKPNVQLTQIFRQALEEDGADPQGLLDLVAAWREDWPHWEDRDYYFGKDGAYATPKRNGQFVLRHVHMPPEDPAHWPNDAPPLTEEDLKKVVDERAGWDKYWDLEKAARYRTSSRVLVYVDGGRHGLLLVHLAREPNGHDETTANKQLMELWADVAEAFIHDGAVLI